MGDYDWESWVTDSRTLMFIKYLFYVRVEAQQPLLDSKQCMREGGALSLGKYECLGEILDKFKSLKGDYK